MNDWLSEYEGMLRPYLPLLGASQRLSPDDRLADLGLDSMGTVGLLVEAEDFFGVAFPDELLSATTFATPAALREAIESLKEPHSDRPTAP